MRNDKTLSFFEQRRPDAVENVMPVIPASPNILPNPNLCWDSQQGVISWDAFVSDTVLASSEDAVFFLDSSFLPRHEIPASVFQSLLSRRVAITPLVWGELQDWFNNPFANAGFRDSLANARASGESSVVWLNPDDWSETVNNSVKYYVSLLLARKHIALHFRQTGTKDGGEETSDKELTRMLQCHVGDRGVELAKKGLKDHEKPNYAADEELLVAAIAHAILSGTETVILTRDRDPLEQFRKVIYLLDTNYRSLLIGEAYLDTPENLIVESLPRETQHDCFEKGDRFSLRLPRRFAEWVLRPNLDPVTIKCCRLAGRNDRMKFATLAFQLERGMLRLLDIKGQTGGLNCELRDGQNCHLAISPPFIPEMSGRAIVGRDRIVTLGPFTGPVVDLEYALQEVQRFRKRAVDLSLHDAPDGVTNGMKLADFYLPQRLCFSSESGWRDIEWSELSKAVHFIDGAATFFVDRRVIRMLDAKVRETLITRRFTWSTSIRDAELVPDALDDLPAANRTPLSKIPAFNVRDEVSYEYGFGYYMALLSIRRQFARIIRDRVRKDHGRELEVGEIGAIAEDYGGRGARRRAEHWETNKHDPLVFAGDELLVYGVVFALVEGTDVVFLTRDPTFLDQFGALMSMLGNDFVAYQFGRTFADDPNAFPGYSTTQNRQEPSIEVLGQATIGNICSGWEKAILPRRPYLINVHCWLLGDDKGKTVQLAALTYCCERGMHNLLRIKGTTFGKNVERLDGRNIRAAHGPPGERATISLWHDRMVHVGTTDFPRDNRLDLRIESVAAVDISLAHSKVLPLAHWCEGPP